MKNNLFIALIIILLCSCSQEENLSTNKFKINVLWSIPTENELFSQEGAIYEDEYFVFAYVDETDWILQSYDLKSLQKKWEHKFEGNVSGWAGKMKFTQNVLYLDNIGFQLELFDMVQKESIKSFRYDELPELSDRWLGSDNAAIAHDQKVYKVLRDYGKGKSMLTLINSQNGDVEKIFKWNEDGELQDFFSPPLVVETESNGIVNLIFSIHLYKRDDAETKSNLLVSIDENYDINWIDTIKSSASYPILHPPVAWKDDVILVSREKMISYNQLTGERNWTKIVNENGTIKVMNLEDELYLNDVEMSRIAGDSGEELWKSRVSSRPSIQSEVILHKDKLLYVEDYDNNGSGRLYGVDKETGERLFLDTETYHQIANPKLYKKENIFITHTPNEIIGFTIERY